MRKALVVMVSIVAMSLIASQALAWCGGGYWRGPAGRTWGGYAPGAGSGVAYQQFMNDTKALRQELAAKQGEYDALMAQPNPDPKRAGELSAQIDNLDEQLQEKAQASNMPGPRYGRGPMGGCGYCPGYGGWGRW